jgi:hypothetical protein
MQVQQRKGTAMSKAAMSKAAKAKTASSKTTAGPMTDGPLAADMGRLARELSQASKSRVSTANDMRRASTKHVRQMANARRKATIDLRTNLSRDVTAFLDIAAQTVPTFARAHQKMAKQQRSSLEAGRQELGAEVSKFRSAIQHDLMGAHQIWSALAHG